MGALSRRIAREYLERAPSLSVLVALNATLVLVGLRFYVDRGRGLAAVPTFGWPLYADSPTATFLATLTFATLLPNVGRPLSEARVTLPLAYLHTFTFVWLVKYGLWTAVALNLGFDAYYPGAFAYFAVLLSHLGFVAEAGFIVHFGRTTRGALAAALALSFANDVFDYGTLVGLPAAYHPPLRYEPGVVLAAATVVLSVLSVALAAHLLPKFETSGATYGDDERSRTV